MNDNNLYILTNNENVALKSLRDQSICPSEPPGPEEKAVENVIRPIKTPAIDHLSSRFSSISKRSKAKKTSVYPQKDPIKVKAKENDGQTEASSAKKVKRSIRTLEALIDYEPLREIRRKENEETTDDQLLKHFSRYAKKLELSEVTKALLDYDYCGDFHSRAKRMSKYLIKMDKADHTQTSRGRTRRQGSRRQLLLRSNSLNKVRNSSGVRIKSSSKAEAKAALRSRSRSIERNEDTHMTDTSFLKSRMTKRVSRRRHREVLRADADVSDDCSVYSSCSVESDYSRSSSD